MLRHPLVALLSLACVLVAGCAASPALPLDHTRLTRAGRSPV
ncbi:hypothetical protein [Burkholderia lata]|nr:hypothetical protein [Burkholderia lata]